MLIQSGIRQVVESSDGGDLLIKLGQFRPELIVMDLNLPGLSGEKLGEMIRKQKIPVVIFSSEREDRLPTYQEKSGRPR